VPGVIFQTSAAAFSALKFVGAGYLVYLASDRTQNILNNIAGTVFLGLALKLATTER
jgi:threonine/homoserine/homoserine lactone efflux protein